jgi:hypothetical protein
MDSAKQAIRWGIPGWLFLLTFFLFDFFYRFFQQDFTTITSSTFWEALKPYLNISSGAAALIGFLCIPLGYVIYQIYFAYQRSLSLESQYRYMDGLLTGVESLKGYESFIEDLKKMEDEEKYYEQKNPIISRFFKNIYKGSAKTIKSVLHFKKVKKVEDIRREVNINEVKWGWIDMLIDSSTAPFEIKQRQRHLSDLYHSLGATRTAIVFSYISLLIVILKDFVIRILNNSLDKRTNIVGILAIILPLFIILISTFVAELNRNNIIINKFIILRYILENFTDYKKENKDISTTKQDKNKIKENEAIYQLSGIKLFYFSSIIFYLLFFIVLYIFFIKNIPSIFSNYFLYFSLLLGLLTVIYLIPLICIYKRKKYSILYTKIILIISALNCPIGTAICFVLWKRISDETVKKFLINEVITKNNALTL